MPTLAARETDWLGRVIGLVVFLVGIGLLIAVFIMTNTALADTPVLPRTKQGIDWVPFLLSFATRLGRLFLLGFIASWIAGRGAQMYAASNRASPHD
jgi:hypothetical protein